MPSVIAFVCNKARNSLCERGTWCSRGSLNRTSSGIAPRIAIHKIHVRGGTRNSPPFFSFLLSSAMSVEKSRETNIHISALQPAFIAATYGETHTRSEEHTSELQSRLH